MDVAILVPGIMGSRLILPAAFAGGKDEEVWPPKPLEVAFGYDRIDKLQSEHLQFGEIIDKVSCFSFYNLIEAQLGDLGFPVGGAGQRRVEFAYDWRQDNFNTADLLAKAIAREHAAGATRISLVCHSMGGLVARLVLESGKFDAEPWFASIRLFAALATPHLGAPLALARIFGLDSSSGISGRDFATLAANRAYPSGYQLIPAPGEAAVWSVTSPDLGVLDPYDPDTAVALGMDPVLVDKARAQHAVLARNAAPGHVRYFYFAGAGHRTVTRINVVHRQGAKVNHGQSVVTRTEAAGDGTVPLYSALPVAGQRQIVVNEHATVFKGTPFRRAFFRLMGGDAGAVVEAATGPEDGPFLSVSLDRPVYSEGERPEAAITVTSPASPDGRGAVEKIEGRFVIERTDPEGAAEAEVQVLPLVWSGPPVSSLTLRLGGPMLAAGLYRMRFEGVPPMPEALAFAVTRE